MAIHCATGQMVEPFLQAGCRVDAIEPNMALARYTGEKFKRYLDCTVYPLPFDRYAPPEGEIDLIVSADPSICLTAFPKLMRMLRAGGSLAFLGYRSTIKNGHQTFPALPSVQPDDIPTSFWTTVYSNLHTLKVVEIYRQNGMDDILSYRYTQKRRFTVSDTILALRTEEKHLALSPRKRMALEASFFRHADLREKILLSDTQYLYLARKPRPFGPM